MTRSTSFLFLLLMLLAALPAAAQQTVSADSRIAAVTVFSDRAQVTRSATVALQPGTNLVSFDGLPLLLAEESLRVEGTGPGSARIAGITVKRVFLDRLQGKRVQELEDEIATLTRRVESVEAQRKALNSQKAFIESIKVGWSQRVSKEITMGRLTAAELSEAVKFVGEGIGKIEEELNDTETAKKPLLRRIEALKKELEQERTDQRKEVRSVQVAVEADRRMQFVVNLSYLVSQASWEPSYDVRLAPDGKGAELVYRALVRQQTGEDWPGVKLSLSTARPEVGGAPPELSPWQVSLYEPPRPLPYPRAKAAMEMETMTFGARPPAPAPPEDRGIAASPATAQVEEGQTSVLFAITAPADIPATGVQSGSVIAVEKVPVTAEYVTVPKLSPLVYLKSEVTNATSYPLLAGTVNVFNDTVFTGKSYLKTVASGEKFDLYFGSDDQLKVKRESARVKKKAGLLGDNSVTYRVSAEVENFKNRPVAVSLLDQLPLPGNAEIKVKLEDAQPKPDETKADGTLVWKLALAAGEKKKVTYDIVIEYPKGRDIVGIE